MWERLARSRSSRGTPSWISRSSTGPGSRGATSRWPTTGRCRKGRGTRACRPGCSRSAVHDAGNAEIMVQQLNGLTYFGMMGTSINVVHQDVVGRLERSTRVINKAPGNGVEAGQVNAINKVQRLYGVDVNQGGRHRQHARQFRQPVANLNRHGRFPHTHDEGRTGGPHQDIGAHALHPPGAIIYHPMAKTHHENDHGHFNGHGQHAHRWCGWAGAEYWQ